MLPLTKEFSEKMPTIVMSICYFVSFYFLTLALRAIPLAIVYACWSGLGVLFIAVLSYFIYGQALSWQTQFWEIILNSKLSDSREDM